MYRGLNFRGQMGNEIIFPNIIYLLVIISLLFRILIVYNYSIYLNVLIYNAIIQKNIW